MLASAVTDWVTTVIAILTLTTAVIVAAFKILAKIDRSYEITCETAKIVKHHLGPNGSTPKLHETVTSFSQTLAAHTANDEVMFTDLGNRLKSIQDHQKGNSSAND